MTADELLDAHVLRLRNDPGYAAIWQRVQGIDRPELRMLAIANAWAEQADGLRAMARANAEEASQPMAVECPYCGVRFGVQITPPATPQTNH
jgi:hypothetical protein